MKTLYYFTFPKTKKMPQTENYIEMRERLARLDMADVFTKVSECLIKIEYSNYK